MIKYVLVYFSNSICCQLVIIVKKTNKISNRKFDCFISCNSNTIIIRFPYNSYAMIYTTVCLKTVKCFIIC